MFTFPTEGAIASTLSFVQPSDRPSVHPSADADPIRHMLFGSLTAVQSTIKLLHKRGYAEPNDWSQPISTGRANEVMAILTKRISVK
ncbi:MAG: hypothetical protein ACFB16_07270 [Phormidesmis sp.]